MNRLSRNLQVMKVKEKKSKRKKKRN